MYRLAYLLPLAALVASRSLASGDCGYVFDANGLRDCYGYLLLP